MGSVRILSGLGALFFVYLALIPGGLIGSTLDSSCAGSGCETSLLSKVAFTAIYGLCGLALVGVAAALANHTLRGTVATERRVQRGLAGAAVIFAGSAFALFAFVYPIAGGVGLLLAAVIYLTLKRLERPTREPDPRRSGHSRNGHRVR